MTNKPSSLLTNIGNLILIAVITLILLEIVLGLTFRIKDKHLIDAETRDYPYMYFLLISDDASRNEDGLKIFRSKEKPDSTFRIITTGGSVVYGQKPDETIAANLEQILKDSFPNQNIEVLNAGIPAYVVEQEFILIQLKLQYYQPDMIISLDGYNDLLSCEINRYYPGLDVLPPHNWRDFKYIRQQEKRRKLHGRFYGIFPNIYRLRDFFFRRSFDKNFEYTDLSNNKELIAHTYRNRIEDINAFCNAKGIDYHHFLQPIRFIDKTNSEREENLESIYMSINDSLMQLSYSSSLTTVFCKNTKVYLDECHVIPTGNIIIAKEIVQSIYPKLQKEFSSTQALDSIQ